MKNKKVIVMIDKKLYARMMNSGETVCSILKQGAELYLTIKEKFQLDKKIQEEFQITGGLKDNKQYG